MKKMIIQTRTFFSVLLVPINLKYRCITRQLPGSPCQGPFSFASNLFSALLQRLGCVNIDIQRPNCKSARGFHSVGGVSHSWYTIYSFTLLLWMLIVYFLFLFKPHKISYCLNVVTLTVLYTFERVIIEHFIKSYFTQYTSY